MIVLQGPGVEEGGASSSMEQLGLASQEYQLRILGPWIGFPNNEDSATQAGLSPSGPVLVSVLFAVSLC